ncbi:MAG: hypothetical protein WCY97_08130 [Methanothrix sp.]|nr:hypothetical protein [Methanothrix sp.]MDD5767958.1 hypothetical protein [Methanothrix sp.]MDI9398348.1 hypothetical protein [Euryarchaeota archaeon]
MSHDDPAVVGMRVPGASRRLDPRAGIGLASSSGAPGIGRPLSAS